MSRTETNREANSEDQLLREVALRNATSILQLRQRAEAELLRTQDALRESQQRLQAALSASHAGTFRWDLTSDTIDSDASLQRIFGLIAGDEVRAVDDFVNAVHPDDRPCVNENVERCRNDAVDFDMEFRVVWPDGSVHWVENKATRMHDASGNAQYLIGACHDITVRKKVEGDLRENAERFRAVFNQAAVGIAVASLDGRLLEVNQQFANILGYAPNDLCNRTVAELTHPDDVEKTAAAMHCFIEQQVEEYVYEKRFIKKDGSAVWSRTRIAFLRNAAGEAEQFIGVVEDITERVKSDIEMRALVARVQEGAEERESLLVSERHARTQAERMSAMKDEFLATLSHELRTPLNAILGWSQLLRHTPQDTTELLRGLDTIERNARVQQQLIEDLLDMSRITSGKLRLNIQSVSPALVIEAAVETIAHAASAKGIRIEQVLDQSAGPISGDPHRLQQVIWNVLSNAIKFTPRDGKVQIILQRVNSHIEICIADTGAGIEPEFLGQVFERFRQADASTTRQQGGLGLGLSIVRHLVELHGGSVNISSAGRGMGTTVILHLPLKVVHRIDDKDERLHPATPARMPFDFRSFDLAGISVLVVDDNADARELVQRVLRECGATVHTAGNAADAVRMVEEHIPHVLVSDIGMPEVDGYELIKRIRSLGSARGGTLPAIALTAFARSEDRTRALRAGFLVHVSKPVEAAELVATVASVVGRSGQQ